MRITILTLFPEMFVGPFSESIVKRAQEKKFVEIQLVHIRDFGVGSHKVVDDKPYGGGVGMVMKVDVIDAALQAVRKTGRETHRPLKEKVVLLDPRGKSFTQAIAKNFSQLEHLILLCAHYEGVDERVRNLVDETISIGDFILTGGEIPAMLVTDAVVRLISGVLKDDATIHESFSIKMGGVTEVGDPRKVPAVNEVSDALFGDDDRQDPNGSLLEYPQYTTPNDYNGMKVPDVLLSGNHAEIEKWRQEEAVIITKKYRPDLLKNSTGN